MDVSNIDTPAVTIDLAQAEANLMRAQKAADAAGVGLRPHIKTHKLPYFAKRQVALGAVGITCQKLGEAEVMADAGLADIFIPYNIIGAAKLARLKALHGQVRLSVTADSAVAVAGYAEAFAGGSSPLEVLVECDTGLGRCGVQSPAAAVALARLIAESDGLRFGGLMSYPPRKKVAEVDAWLVEARDACGAAGFDVKRVSNGGSPDFFDAIKVTSATEFRPGTYIYSDRMQAGFGHGTLDDCALAVLATVVSMPTGDRVILDAGSKALGTDPAPMPGYGYLPEYPEAMVASLNEEHAICDFSGCAERPKIGDRIKVIPNHVCIVSNLFAEVHLMDGDKVIEVMPVAARGRSA